MSELSGKQRRFLRARGHVLHVVVHIGKEGVTDSVVKALDVALETHELVKVRVGQGSTVDRHTAADDLAAQTKSQVAQVLGKTILLYRRHPDEPKLQLPG